MIKATSKINGEIKRRVEVESNELFEFRFIEVARLERVREEREFTMEKRDKLLTGHSRLLTGPKPLNSSRIEYEILQKDKYV